jgi:hypothetical protein
MNKSSHLALRFATSLFAILLGVQCVWLLFAELSRPGIHQLPTDAASAAAARNKRIDANRAAMIGAIRGDLWRDSAFTYAVLM